jgi:hypothetical protein
MTLPVVIWSIWLNGGLARASAALVCFIAAVLPFMALYIVLLQRPKQQRRDSTVEPGSALAVGNVS